jgi:exonuclease VII large subunit
MLCQQPVQRRLWQLEQYERQLPQVVSRRLERAQWRLEQLAQRHELLRLETSLARGFSVFTQADAIIRSKVAVADDLPATVYFQDGERVFPRSL